jgi:hypothetical protein
MKVAVIGGGFTGCMAALQSARDGHEVTLLESSESLGGVLREVETADGLYFNGCQYLNQGSVDRLEWSDGLTEFPHEYGSVTSLGNDRIRIFNDCAQPSLAGEVQLCEEALINESALQRLQAYGSQSPYLIEWAQSFGDLAQLDWRCLIPMQLSRMHFPEDTDVPRLKKEAQRANELLALPRRLRGQAAEWAWLPSEGYTQFFARLEQAMIDLGVRIRLNSPVKPELEEGRVSLRSRAETISADAVVWTANPQPLLSRIYGVRLSTPAVPMKLLVGDLLKGVSLPVTLPYYWQVFDSSSCVVRLYAYELGGKLKFSAETFNTVDDDTAWLDLKRLMHQCGLGDGHHLVSVVKQNRHVNFSQSELKAFETLTSKMLQQGVVPGGWQHYGREEKVKNILSTLGKVWESRHEASYA